VASSAKPGPHAGPHPDAAENQPALWCILLDNKSCREDKLEKQGRTLRQFGLEGVGQFMGMTHVA